jgi:hypothetical protein
LRELSKLGLPFLFAGTYALSVYTGIVRATKDLDILCKPSDYPRILQRFKSLGYAVEIEDERSQKSSAASDARRVLEPLIAHRHGASGRAA